MSHEFKTTILSIKERTRVMAVRKVDPTDPKSEWITEYESLGWFALIDSTPNISIWVGNKEPTDLKPGPCKLILSQETAQDG